MKNQKTLHGIAPSWRSYFWVQLWEKNQVHNHSYMDTSDAVNPGDAGVLALVSDLQDKTVLRAQFHILKTRNAGLLTPGTEDVRSFIVENGDRA